MSEIEDLGGMHAARIEQMVLAGDTAVRKEAAVAMAEVNDRLGNVESKIDAIVGCDNALGDYVPGRLDKQDARLDEILALVQEGNRAHAEDSRARTEAEIRRHKEWAEGEELRQQKRDADARQSLEERKEILDHLKALSETTAAHERQLESRITKIAAVFMRILKRMEATKAKLITFWALVSSVTGLTVGGVWIGTKWLGKLLWKLIIWSTNYIEHHK